MPNVKRKQLSTLQVKNAKPGVYTGGGRLTLRVKPSGRRNWVLRLTINGKLRNLGLGAYSGVSLKAAREQADELRKAARRGEDPADHLKAHRTAPESRKPPSPRSLKPPSMSSRSEPRPGQAPATRPNGGRVSGFTHYPS